MPGAKVSKGKGRIIESGNIEDQRQQRAAGVTVTQKATSSPLFADPDCWADAPMVIVLSGCTWDSSGGNQRPVAMSKELAKIGHHVIYVCGGVSRVQWAGNAIIVPYATLRKEVTSILSAAGTVLCTLPTPQYLDLCAGLSDNGWTVVYDVLDDWKAFAEDDYADWYRQDVERAMMKHVDALTASAPQLQKRVKEWSDRDAVLVPNGGPSEAFKDMPKPEDMRQGIQGTVVYSGHLQGPWFHWYMLAQTISDLPDVEFTVVGSTSGCNVPDADNVNFVGSKPYNQAMAYIANADVGIIPFQSDAVCEAVDPIKWYDYIAGRCRTVATWSLVDVHGRPFTEICPEGALSMAPQIRNALEEPAMTEDEANAVLEETGASWKNRTRQLMEVAGCQL